MERYEFSNPAATLQETLKVPRKKSSPGSPNGRNFHVVLVVVKNSVLEVAKPDVCAVRKRGESEERRRGAR